MKKDIINVFAILILISIYVGYTDGRTDKNKVDKKCNQHYHEKDKNSLYQDLDIKESVN